MGQLAHRHGGRALRTYNIDTTIPRHRNSGGKGSEIDTDDRHDSNCGLLLYYIEKSSSGVGCQP